jgi:hypothetical protein
LRYLDTYGDGTVTTVEEGTGTDVGELGLDEDEG